MYLYFTQMDPIPNDVRDTLAGKGWRVEHLPFRKAVLLDSHIDPKGFDLVIISSKQAARWLVARPPFQSPPIAVVGRSSSTILADYNLFFGDDPPPNAAALTDRLQDHLDPQQRYLFLRGAKITDTIPKGFLNYRLTEEIVYRTDKLLKKFPPLEENAMVYFQAPRSVRDYAATYKQPPKRIGAIGPTTARAIHELGWTIDFQPSRPETHHFAATIPKAGNL